jgi:N-glycosylase/DNA lyase
MFEWHVDDAPMGGSGLFFLCAGEPGGLSDLGTLELVRPGPFGRHDHRELVLFRKNEGVPLVEKEQPAFHQGHSMTSGTLVLPHPFSLGLTLLCGQCFRWDGPSLDDWFQGVAGQVHWRLKQGSEHLLWECSSQVVCGQAPEEWLSRYLSLDDDLEGWARSLDGHPVMGQPLQVLRGLRLLRQEPWECTISYMFAQGLSVKVIRHALRKFCVEYGRLIEGAPGFYTFPEAKALAGLSADFMRPFINNDRAQADRIIRMARAVEAQVISLNHLQGIPCDDAREALMALDGIGPKIADCILLFSMDQASAFPVDRWVLRAMKRHFRSVQVLGPGEDAPTRIQYLKIVRKARDVFGSRCGVASEYLFLFLRLLEDAKLRKELGPYCPKPEGASPEGSLVRSFRTGKAL